MTVPVPTALGSSHSKQHLTAPPPPRQPSPNARELDWKHTYMNAASAWTQPLPASSPIVFPFLITTPCSDLAPALAGRGPAPTLHTHPSLLLQPRAFPLQPPLHPLASVTTGSDCGHRSICAKEMLDRDNHQVALQYTGDGWKESLYLGVWENCSWLHQRKNPQFLADSVRAGRGYLNIARISPLTGVPEYISYEKQNPTEYEWTFKAVRNHLTFVSLNHVSWDGDFFLQKPPMSLRKGEWRDYVVSSELIPWSECANPERWYSQRSLWCNMDPQSTTGVSINTTPWPLPGAGRQIRVPLHSLICFLKSIILIHST